MPEPVDEGRSFGVCLGEWENGGTGMATGREGAWAKGHGRPAVHVLYTSLLNFAPPLSTRYSPAGES
jgi:hypothetical protein